MRLLIVSHTPHYTVDGAMAGWGPTVREIDALSSLFAEVVHVAPVHHEPAPASTLPYQASNVRIRAVRPAGGHKLKEKFSILARVPGYVAAVRQELKHCDAVHVRCPANISLVTSLLLAVTKAPGKRWLKYAGNWKPTGGEPWSYAFQRWWLAKGPHGGEVTVNGSWPGQPAHVHSFYNPCLTTDEVDEARQASMGKALTDPLRLLFVGRLEENKGVARCLEIISRLTQRGCPATLDLVGDGPERSRLEEMAGALGVSHRVRFHGALPRTSLGPVYQEAHIMIFPSATEGWPKVLSEGMAYGVVPIASNVSSIPQYLQQFGTGRTVEPYDVDGFVRAVEEYAADPGRWADESRLAVAVAPEFTYERYVQSVRTLLRINR